MMKKPFPVIDPVATGANIVRLREDRDNLYALGALLDVTMDEILVQTRPKLNILVNEQQAKAACCSPRFWGRLTQLLGVRRKSKII